MKTARVVTKDTEFTGEFDDEVMGEEKEGKDSPDGEGKPKDKDKDRDNPSTAPMREILAEEDASLKGVLDTLGSEGSFRISLFRSEPEEWTDPATGRRVKTAGKLKTYTSKIDEDFIAGRHGGGKYQLKFLRRKSNGSYKFLTQRTIDIAGDPRVDDVPRTIPAAAAALPAQGGDNPSLIKEAFGVLKDQLDRANEPRESAAPRGMDPAVQMMLEQMQRALDRRDDESVALRRELAEARSYKPPEDPLKDKILGSLIDGESGRIAGLRQQHESELRQIRDFGIEEQRRREDRHERDLANLKQGYEREIAAIKSSQEVALASAKSSYELQVKLLETDNRRMERDITELRTEVKELRARKDLSIVEQAKQLEAVRDALGLDEGGDKSNFDKLLELAASPAAVEAIQRIVGSGDKPAAAAQAAAAAVPRGPSRQLMTDADGQRVWLVTDASGGQRILSAKKKPKVIPATTAPDGTVVTPEIELPEIDPAAIAMLVGYLERAFSGKQDPEVVAQSHRSSVPDEILTWIRANDTEQTSGVDLFMSKVAKLPSTSSLSSQSGRNWLRRVGKALVGE